MSMKTLSAVVCLAALAACSETGSMQDEVGAGLDPSFGRANAANTIAMSSPRDAIISLTRKFAAEVPNTVNFAFNSAVLDGQAQTALRQQAAWIARYPDVRFRVYGYTDLVGSNAYNQALGLKRAQAVVAFLSSQGISRARLEAVVSYGKTQPLVYVPGPNERNRRAVTEVSGFMKTGSGSLMNGKYAKVIFDEYVKSATPDAGNTVQSQTSVGTSATSSSSSGSN